MAEINKWSDVLKLNLYALIYVAQLNIGSKFIDLVLGKILSKNVQLLFVGIMNRT